MNPLPFEHLEPKRFEDLVRQLAYDFRQWQSLEATGRAGSDEGFDARGYEVRSDSDPVDSEDSEDEEPGHVGFGRIWLIQCKRERSIPPSKVRQHLGEIQLDPEQPLYGMLFAAACDFSKKTRDAVRLWARDNGLAEVVIWGKAEIEDLLFQPKYDHILFAYFGISLRIRQISIKTALRAKLSMKRKCERVLKDARDVLLRDPTDDRYPHVPETDAQANPPRWMVRRLVQQVPQGLVIERKSLFAYIDDEEVHWDAVDDYDQARPVYDHAWRDDEPHEELGSRSHRARHFWLELPEGNRANLIHYTLIRFEDILDIDEAGDMCAQFPHIYIERPKLMHRGLGIEHWRFRQRRFHPVIPGERIKFFPAEFPPSKYEEAAAELGKRSE